jgi:adenylyltransferase/sulfurtransferase
MSNTNQAAADAPEITVEELNRRREAGEALLLLDVREPQEYEIARIEGARLIPLGQLPDRLGELNNDVALVVHCHSGMRSARAVQFLRQTGFPQAVNLAGGIDAWSERIDPAVPQY